jgi:hypothetical protein
MSFALPAFDPDAGTLVLAPEKREPGYWAGCANVLHENGRFWMTYRQRRPRGADVERGWRCAVAVSDDGVTFTDVWQVHKQELNAPSMERFSLVPAPGGYDLYISYVDPADNRWRIDALHATDPSQFNIADRRPVLTAATTSTEGVKDPYVFRAGPVTYLIASYAAAKDGLITQAHSTADIYNVGATTHPTGLASSIDGTNFTWHGEILAVGADWDRYQARLNSIVAIDGGYVGFYDGSASHAENFEERCGIAVSGDLFTWRSVSPEHPWVVTPHASGSVRYLDAHIIDGEWWLYYELTCADGSHELRLTRVPTA